MNYRRDLIVVGAGIIGLAVARALHARFPEERLMVLEKESDVGRHQTGHNSGVVHSGVYYRPGSLKARLCVEGRRRMIAYLRSQNLPYEECGKVIIAIGPVEEDRLRELQRRAIANGVEGTEWIDPSGLRGREPNARGTAALWVPGTAITDYARVAKALATELANAGIEVRRGSRLTGARPSGSGFVLETTNGPIEAGFLVNCGGLHCDRIASMMGVHPSVAIVPFRGDYYHVRAGRQDLVKGLVYPVPDPAFPFLGVHFTRRIDGGLEAGPNAVLSFDREGYGRARFRWADTAATLAFPGFWHVARRHLRTGVFEAYRAFDRHRYAADLQRLVPSISADDLEPGGCGIRAQAVGADGTLVDDFVLQAGTSSLHLLNAPSPGATASLSIGDYVAARVPNP
jgi:L-2-hydroxyglutarate oxidase